MEQKDHRIHTHTNDIAAKWEAVSTGGDCAEQLELTSRVGEDLDSFDATAGLPRAFQTKPVVWCLLT